MDKNKFSCNIVLFNQSNVSSALSLGHLSSTKLQNKAGFKNSKNLSLLGKFEILSLNRDSPRQKSNQKKPKISLKKLKSTVNSGNIVLMWGSNLKGPKARMFRKRIQSNDNKLV